MRRPRMRNPKGPVPAKLHLRPGAALRRSLMRPPKLPLRLHSLPPIRLRPPSRYRRSRPRPRCWPRHEPRRLTCCPRRRRPRLRQPSRWQSPPPPRPDRPLLLLRSPTGGCRGLRPPAIRLRHREESWRTRNPPRRTPPPGPSPQTPQLASPACRTRRRCPRLVPPCSPPHQSQGPCPRRLPATLRPPRERPPRPWRPPSPMPHPQPAGRRLLLSLARRPSSAPPRCQWWPPQSRTQGRRPPLRPPRIAWRGSGRPRQPVSRAWHAVSQPGPRTRQGGTRAPRGLTRRRTADRRAPRLILRLLARPQACAPPSHQPQAPGGLPHPSRIQCRQPSR